jgi:hypothetical protein
MAISLYDVSVGGYLQTLGAITDVLTKGKAHYEEIGADPNELVGVRLFPDMLPLAFQIWSVKHHSLGAIEGCKAGTFGPPPSMPQLDYEGLRQVLSETGQALAAVDPAEVNALEGRDMTFQIGDFKLPFVVEDFVMSFSIPNFHFHATTAYDILRTRGVKLGKRDYMGLMRIKKPQAAAI